jgi:hypothetical protein
MPASKVGLAIPIVIVLVGVGWLLNTLDLIPDINWVWTLGLAAVGVATLMVEGINRLSVVVGPFFLCAAFFSVLRQSGQISEKVEAPCLVILLGILLIVSQVSKLPPPEWILEDDRPRKDQRD